MELTKINAKDDMILLKSDTGESGWFRFIDMLCREGKEYAALADEAAGGKYGARDLRRVIRDEIEDPATDILVKSGGFFPASISVSLEDGKIRVR